jgi:hypothetical protein
VTLRAAVTEAQFAGVVRKYTQTWHRIIKASGFQPK